MFLSHVRQCFSIDLDAKTVDLKEPRSLKRAGEQHSDEEDNKDALKKFKYIADLKAPTSHGKGLTIKLKQPAAVSTSLPIVIYKTFVILIFFFCLEKI